MIWVQVGLAAAQVVALGLTVKAMLSARNSAARAGVAFARAKDMAEWADRSAAMVPFPRRSDVG